jgi:hypothetical protein
MRWRPCCGVLSFALRADDNLQWHDCRAASASDIVRLLDACERPVVLVVDEINAVLRPVGEQRFKGSEVLWQWLKQHFLRGGRELVFSSHYNDTYEQVVGTFAPTPRPRLVEVLSPPLVEDPRAEAALFRGALRVTPEAIALMGRVPGHIIDSKSYDVLLHRVDWAERDLRPFARTCLASADSEMFMSLPRSVRAVGLFEGGPGRGRYRWTPYCIAHALGRSTPLVTRVGAAMTVAKSGSGEMWELIVAMAICLHRLAGVPHPYLAPAGEVSPVGDVVGCPAHIVSWDALESWIATDVPGHALVLPSAAAFPGIDIIECVDRKPVGEYQVKTGDGQPSCAAHLRDAAWLMVGDGPNKPYARADGWIKCGREEMKSFLGDSLHCAVPHLWHGLVPVSGAITQDVTQEANPILSCIHEEWQARAPRCTARGPAASAGCGADGLYVSDKRNAHTCTAMFPKATVAPVAARPAPMYNWPAPLQVNQKSHFVLCGQSAPMCASRCVRSCSLVA